MAQLGPGADRRGRPVLDEDAGLHGPAHVVQPEQARVILEVSSGSDARHGAEAEAVLPEEREVGAVVGGAELHRLAGSPQAKPRESEQPEAVGALELRGK